MNCDIDTPVQQRLFQFFRKHTHTADYGERITFHIACSLDDFDVDLELRVELQQAFSSLFCLPQCEFGTAGADDERASHFGHSSRPKRSEGACIASGSPVS